MGLGFRGLGFRGLGFRVYGFMGLGLRPATPCAYLTNLRSLR